MWTPDSFRARWPEFRTAADTVIQGALNEAVARVDPALGGTDTDTGVGYKAAEILALSPFGQQARLQAKDGSTTYGKLFDEWVRNRGGGPWITGQAATTGGSIW